MDSDTKKRLDNLLKNAAEFKPYTYYDAVDDTLLVKLEDVSYTEHNISECIDTYTANHSENKKHIIGFRLYDVMMHTRSIQGSGHGFLLTELLNVYIRRYSEAAFLNDLNLDALGLKINLFYCTECKSWTLFEFENRGICDDCAMSEMLDKTKDFELNIEHFMPLND